MDNTGPPGPGANTAPDFCCASREFPYDTIEVDYLAHAKYDILSNYNYLKHYFIPNNPAIFQDAVKFRVYARDNHTPTSAAAE